MNKIINNKGFTLIELVIVIIILGVLATLVGPRMVSSIKSSKINTLVGNINSVEKVASQIFAETNDISQINETNINAKLSKTMTQMGLSITTAAAASGTGFSISFGINPQGTGVSWLDLTTVPTGGVSAASKLTAGAAGLPASAPAATAIITYAVTLS